MATGRIGVTPTLGTRWSKAPAGGTTSLSGLDDNSVALVYSVGYEQVYRNGVLLSRGNDYTATTGNSITLIDATIAGDIIEVFANELVPLTDAISKGQFTAKGALLSATAASTPAVLTVGSNDQVLTADSSTATGLKWATPASGGMTLLASGSIAASATGIDISSISGSYNDLVLYVRGMSTNTDNEDIGMRFNNDSGSTYYRTWINSSSATVASNGGTSLWIQALNTASAETAGYLVVRIFDYTNTSSVKSCFTQGMARKGTNTLAWGFWDNTSAVNRIQIYVTGTAAFDSGTYALYGVK